MVGLGSEKSFETQCAKNRLFVTNKMADPQPLVIENGTAMIKAGFAGDDAPRAVFPGVVNYSKDKNKEPWLGDDLSRANKQTNPIQGREIQDWDAMEVVWHHTFYNELRIEPSQHEVLLTEPIFNPKVNREKTMETMFELFKTPSFFLAKDCLLALFSAGRTTGTIIDLGTDVSYVAPIYDQVTLSHAVQRLNYGGSTITQSLMRLLAEKGNTFTTSAEREVVRDIKEKLCNVALHYDDNEKEKANKVPRQYELPDGEVISVGFERFQAPEGLFQPRMMGTKQMSIPDVVNQAIARCDQDIQKDLYSNIVLAGGTTLFTGLSDRLQKELQIITPPLTRIKIVAPPERKYSVWIGGSILASISSFNDFKITKKLYEEHGLSFVHKRCF